jgi:hypothetical protein
MDKSSFKAEEVTKIYMGLDRHCRCGCGGEYVERGDPIFEKRLRRFAQMLPDYKIGDYDEGPNYLNISYGQNRALCVYND